MLLSPLSADLTQLHTLWKDVFGDEDGYIDLFFSGAYVSSHPFAVVKDGEVQSVLYLLDCALQSGSYTTATIFMPRQPNRSTAAAG